MKHEAISIMHQINIHILHCKYYVAKALYKNLIFDGKYYFGGSYFDQSHHVVDCVDNVNV